MPVDHRQSDVPIALCLGANLGDRAATIRRAAALLGQRGLRELRLSSMLETAPWDCPPDAPPYVNAALTARTDLAPEALLALCMSVERELGRDRSAGYHADRSIDIDIALYGDQSVSATSLRIPHPGVWTRDFFLIPLAELAADWRLPDGGPTVGELLNRLPDIDCEID